MSCNSKRQSQGRFLALVVILCLCSEIHAQTSSSYVFSSKSREAIERFYNMIDGDVKSDNIGGITAAVVVGDRVASVRAFGWADREKRIPATAQTIYRIGSISKSITAVTLVRLAEKGVVKLEDPVEKYLPEIENLRGYSEYPPITLQQLASHTAGLVREPELENAAAGPIEEWENKVLVSIPTTSFLAAPGERFSYSNIGFGILGLTISRAAKTPFMDLVEELIFDPLHMEESTFVISGELAKYLSVGYANRRDGSVDRERPFKEHSGRGYKVPNGGVYTTVTDLAKFIGSQTGTAKSAILTDQSIREIQRIQTPGNGSRHYGLGFFIETTDNGTQVISHTGGVAGYRVYHGFDSGSKIGVILFRNYNVGKTDLREAGTTLLDQLVVAQRESDSSSKQD